jgi:hypothetical protein
MKEIDFVEQWLRVSSRDQSKKINYLRALLRQTLWFPVDYHPELGDPYEPGVNDEIPFWIGGNDEETFIPIFSSPKLMRIEMKRMERRHSRARMKGSDLMTVLSRTNYTVMVNPGDKVRGRIDKMAVRDLASGKALEDAERMENFQATFNVLAPGAWPEEWRERLKGECEGQPGVIAVWIATVIKGTDNVAADALHFPIWVRDYQRTPVDGILRAARLAFPGRKLEFPRLDEKNHAQSIAALRTHPPVFPRPE